MPEKILLALLLIYCTYSFAAEIDSNTPLTDEVSEIKQAPPIDEIPTKPLITLEQTLANLKAASGKIVKMDKSGEILETDSSLWDCLHQKSSSLTWEVKATSGLRDKTNTYTWTEHKPQQNALLSWFENIQGKCTGSARCETSDYIANINQLKLCNFTDWRLPTKAELESLVAINKSKGEAKINSQYFPNTLASWYWTADSNKSHPDFAWYVLFKNGITLSDKKQNPKHLRLVRGTL